MKDFLSDLGKLLFTGIGLIQTIVTVILVIVVASYYNFSYKNLAQPKKVLAETVQCCSGTPECGAGRQCVTGTDPSCTLQGKGECEDMPGPAQGCCKTKADCAPWEECRIRNDACGAGGYSCGIKQEQCKANGNTCSGSWECCSGQCNDKTKICEGGAPFTPRSSDQVCKDEGGSITSTCIADANCKANGGTCCNKGSTNYCCYGDSSTRKDGACYAGGQQTKVTCSGRTITNNSATETITIRVFKGQGEDIQCPISSPGGADRQLAPRASMTAHCEQLDAPGYCGVCDDSECSPPPETPTPPSRPTPTPTRQPSPTPTPTRRPTPTPTTRPSCTPTPTRTSPTPTTTPTPSLPSCGELCTSNWNGSPQDNGECPQNAPTCWAFSTTEWRCVINPDWDNYGCQRPSPTTTPTPTSTPTPAATPTPILSCFNECDHDSDCRSNLYCQEVSGTKRCVNRDCSDESDCTCNRSCWDVCGHDSECPHGLSCLQIGETKRCINPSCQLEEDCGCEAELTPTPTKPAVLGAVAPKIIPKSGTPEELTSGLITIGIVGVLLRLAFLLI